MSERQGSHRVLVIGIYLSDRKHAAVEISEALALSEHWAVDQKWLALGSGPIPERLSPVTIAQRAGPAPKFHLINELLTASSLAEYEYVIIVDDDISLPNAFLDRFLERVVRHDFALAQPARTHDSNIDHVIVAQVPGIGARWTRFVEIGPLVAIRADAVDQLIPFDESSGMGWGYDFVWPRIVEAKGLRMGIVDATPIAHTLRPPVTLYDAEETRAAMHRLLEQRKHLTAAEAFVVVEAYE